MNATGGGGYLKGMKHLRGVGIGFDSDSDSDGDDDDDDDDNLEAADGNRFDVDRCVNHEAVLETLEPPPNIKRLYIRDYDGTTINWTIFPSNLVDIMLWNCVNLQKLPVVSKLPHLKSLNLESIYKLEYMESTSSNSSSDTEATTPELPTFFPSLETLELYHMEKLKGFGNIRSSSFPRLSELEIRGCPNLTSFPPCPNLSELTIDNCPNLTLFPPCPSISKLTIQNCPNLMSYPPCPSLEELKLKGNNEALQIAVKIIRGKEEEDNAGAGNSQDDDNVKLRKVKIDNLGYLKSLPTNCLTHLEIKILYETDVEIELEVVEAFQKSASSLQSRHIDGINKLNRLFRTTGLEHFTALDELKFVNINDHQTRKTLHLHYCPKLNSLPEWIRSLSSLQSMTICLYPASFLQRLTIWIDYPKIQHIPKIILKDD
ncbi:hypothetical protein SOVF_141770 [Spinacia oleracea]|nr:hypothetical protein SOVF_141770 [Spinacia oleracea]